MTLTIKQQASYEGEDRWSWAIWLDGPEAELATVEAVAYHLHPTFPNPKRRVTDAGSKFRLEGAGWGEFTIVARLEYRDGSEEVLRHHLELAYPEGQVPDEQRAPPVVFVSHSAADQQFAKKLREALNEHDVIVLTPDDFEAGLPLEASLEAALEGSDALLVIESEHPSPWVEHEVALAERIDLPIMPVITSEKVLLPPTLRRVQAVKMQGLGADETASVAAAIREALGKIR